MTPLMTFGCGLIAGLHGACYGAWKDSPFESFRPRRFVRELLIASAASFWLTRVLGVESPLPLILGAFALARIVTEFYKLFFRSEEQTRYRIPTEAHFFKQVVASRPLRGLMGIGWILAAYGVYGLLKLLPNDMSPQLSGPLGGLAFGTTVAIAGAYKDGLFEGFYLRKFLKSPLMGAAGGLLVSFHTARLDLLVLGAIALERMFNEFFFKLMRPGYVPGKFLSTIAAYPRWQAERKWFLVPYALTWALILYTYLGSGPVQATLQAWRSN